VQRLISVLRRPAAIVALVSERTHPFCPDSGQGHDGGAYSERVIPLSAASESVCPWKDKDVKAWRALASVPSLGDRAGLAIVRSIIGSVADPATPVDGLPELSFAAGSVDLRPYLCAPDGEHMLLECLGNVLDEVASALDFPDWHWKRRHDIAALPAEFRRSFLWGLHLSPWPMVRVTLAVYDELELEHNGDLRAAMARLLSFAERKAGIAWCEVIAQVDPPQRARAAELILESGAHARDPGAESPRALVESDWQRAYALLAAARRGRQSGRGGSAA
jgi:hypothetical protein